MVAAEWTVKRGQNGMNVRRGGDVVLVTCDISANRKKDLNLQAGFVSCDIHDRL